MPYNKFLLAFVMLAGPSIMVAFVCWCIGRIGVGAFDLVISALMMPMVTLAVVALLYEVTARIVLLVRRE